MPCAARCGVPTPDAGRGLSVPPSPTLSCDQARSGLHYPRLCSRLLGNGFLQTSGGVFVSKSGLFLCFSHLHPDLASLFSPPVSGLGSSVPRSLHLPSVSHSALRIRWLEWDLQPGVGSQHCAVLGAGYWVLGAGCLGNWEKAASGFPRKLGKL